MINAYRLDREAAVIVRRIEALDHAAQVAMLWYVAYLAIKYGYVAFHNN